MPPKLVGRPDPDDVALAGWEQQRSDALGEALVVWYAEAGRTFPWRAWNDLYRLTVVEVLLQRTRADTVRAFAPPFFARFPDWQSLATAPLGSLVRALGPIGLQERRATSLKALAHAVVDRGVSPESRDAPGIGQYISRAVAVAARNEPVAMVDANWVRVIKRVFGGRWMSDYRYDRRLQSIARTVVRAGGDSRSVNWAMLDLGATVCRPVHPRCAACPLSDACEFANHRPPDPVLA